MLDLCTDENTGSAFARGPVTVDGMTTLQRAQQPLIVACDLSALGRDDTRLSRAAQRGTLARVQQSVYIDRALWDDLPADDRHRLLAVIAQRVTGAGLVFSHQTAAELIGLPVLRRWPDRAHVLRECADGGRSTQLLARHTIGVAGVPIEKRTGLTVTAPVRTVNDLAATLPFDAAVAAMDTALLVDRRTRRCLTTRAANGSMQGGSVRGGVTGYVAACVSRNA